MGSGIEEWWAGDYLSESIKNYQKMKVYKHFRKCKKPFTKKTEKFREAYWIDDNCDIYEWYDNTKQTGEKFGHDHNSDTYFYEYWWLLEDNIRKVRKVWFCDPIEWGVIITYYPDHEDIVSWTMEKDLKVLETKKKYKDRTEGKKVGVLDTEDGPEEFVENYLIDEDKIRKEREWRRPNGEGIEKEACEGDRKWGESKGNKGEETWENKWEKDSQGSFEETRHKNPFKKWGNLRNRKGSDEYKVDWTGAKPEFGAEPKNVGNEKVGSQLWALYLNLKENLESKLNRLLNSSPNSKPLQEIQKDLRSLKNPQEFDPIDSISAIRLLEAMRERLDLFSKLEHAEKLFKKLIYSSLKTLQELKLNESSNKFEQDFMRAMEKGTNEILNIENEPQGFDEFKHIEEVLLEIEKVKQDLIRAKGTKEFKLEEFVEKAVEDQKATASALQKLLEDSPASELKEKGKKLVGKAQELLNNPDRVPELIKDFMEIRAEESKIIQYC